MPNHFHQTIAISLTNESLSAVQLSHGRSGVKVSHFYSVTLPAGVLEEEVLVLDSNIFKEKLKELMQGGGKPFLYKNVILSFSEKKVFSHRFKLEKEQPMTSDYIAHLAKDYIPIDLQMAVSDFKRMEIEGDAYVQYVAAQKNAIQPLIDLLAEVGLSVLFVDVRSNGLSRLAKSNLPKKEDPYLLIDLNAHRSLLMISAEGKSSATSLSITGEVFIKEVKKHHKVSLAEAHQLLFSGSLDQKLVGKWAQMIKKEMDAFLSMVHKSENIAPHQFMLTGPYSLVSGLQVILKSLYSDIQWLDPYQNIKSESLAIRQYPALLGAAMLSVLPGSVEDEINLSPDHQRRELTYFILTPLIRKFLIASTVLVGGAALWFAYLFTMTFIDFQVSQREVQLSLERAESPYLVEQARQTQAQAQLKNQIDQILAANVPFYHLIERLNQYNTPVVQLLSLNFSVNRDPKLQAVRLRAKVASRSDTEALISLFEEDPYFTNVVSPLSNLTGIGERFVNVELSFDIAQLNEVIQPISSEDDEVISSSNSSS